MSEVTDPYRSIKIKRETYRTAKIRAAEMGMKLVDYFEYLAESDKLAANAAKIMTPVTWPVDHDNAP